MSLLLTRKMDRKSKWILYKKEKYHHPLQFQSSFVMMMIIIMATVMFVLLQSIPFVQGNTYPIISFPSFFYLKQHQQQQKNLCQFPRKRCQNYDNILSSISNKKVNDDTVQTKANFLFCHRKNRLKRITSFIRYPSSMKKSLLGTTITTIVGGEQQQQQQQSSSTSSSLDDVLVTDILSDDDNDDNREKRQPIVQQIQNEADEDPHRTIQTQQPQQQQQYTQEMKSTTSVPPTPILYVTKRDGRRELLDPQKIYQRIEKVLTLQDYFPNDSKNDQNSLNQQQQQQQQQKQLDSYQMFPTSVLTKVKITSLCESIVRGMYDNVTTQEIDVLIAETAASLCTQHIEYNHLAARITITNNHKVTATTFTDAMKTLLDTPSTTSSSSSSTTTTHDTTSHHQNDNHHKPSTSSSFLHSQFIDLLERRGDEINARIRHERDLSMTYFGYKTLERSYLLRHNTNNNQQYQHQPVNQGQQQQQQQNPNDNTPTDSKPNLNHNTVIERPQYLFMRVALGIHCTGDFSNDNDNSDDFKKEEEDKRLQAAFETYEYMSRGIFTHASPTLFHSGTAHPQLSSCFLVGMKADSIVGIYDTLKDCAVISKAAGGIGLSVHNIRARGTPIHGTRGVSNGLVPMLRVYDVTSRYVDQGGGKRPGAFAIYIEPWHADVLDVLNLKKNHGKEEQRARDLFYGLWIPDLFMRRVQEDGTWSLMCPHDCPGLADCYGTEFETLYTQYENEQRFVRQIRARDLWSAIIESQIETGTPYMLYKDACNSKSNQQNLGTIQCSNLCTEIIQYTSPEETAVCNLASICLSKFVTSNRGPFGSIHPMSASSASKMSTDQRHHYFNNHDNKHDVAYFDHEALHEATKVVTRNLNKIIDINDYPVLESRISNLKHRPIGIGVSGLADVFLRLGLPFTSPSAKQLNAAIFETIYHAALEASVELAMEEGPYETFQGSPASKGIVQFDLWEQQNQLQSTEEIDQLNPSYIYSTSTNLTKSPLENGPTSASGPAIIFASQHYSSSAQLHGYDWVDMRERIKQRGLRNSLLLAPMPTASTSQILGVNECFEPFSSNLYIRRVKAGEFIMANPHLLQDLTDNGLWTPAVRNQMMLDGGSIQNIPEIPDRLKELYKTVWELKMKDIIDMAADRGKYIDQSQSLNLFIADPTIDKLTAMHFYAWKKGLKTGMYYLRTKAAVNAIQYTVDNTNVVATTTPSSSSSTNQPVSVGAAAAGLPEAENENICLSCQ